MCLLCLGKSTLAFTLVALTKPSALHHLHGLVAELLGHSKALVGKLMYIHKVVQLGNALHILIHEILLHVLSCAIAVVLTMVASVASSLRRLHFY